MTGVSSGNRFSLDACFLGPYGENDTLLEKLVVEFLRDHVYWRRKFHPVKGISYVERYFEFLARRICALCALDQTA